MLQAMNTGHDGSLTTVHSNAPRDALSRMETMVLMAGMDLPVRAIREQIASAINVIIQQDRFSDGTRKITSVTEIVGMENDVITMQELFRFVQTGVDEEGAVRGYFTGTDCVPTFMEEIRVRGLSSTRRSSTASSPRGPSRERPRPCPGPDPCRRGRGGRGFRRCPRAAGVVPRYEAD